MPALTINSPLGTLTLREANGCLSSLDWGDTGETDHTDLLDRAADQINRYFEDGRAAFDLPTAPAGTAFQKSVWDQIAAIPSGQTLTYGDIAKKLGTAARAVGTACGRNPVPIIVPCHRVMGANQQLTGYTGADGIETKKFLLVHEGVLTADMV